MPIRSRAQPGRERVQRRPRSGRLPLMAGNWKMNLNHLEAIALVQKIAFTLREEEYDDVEVVVLPPFTDLRSVQTLVDGDQLLVRYGAQDVSAHTAGAHTGEVSGAMLAKLGCTYVLVGHSERRAEHAETDELVNAKLRAAVDAGLTPILCVGEGLEVRRSGQHVPHCLTQVTGGLDGVPAATARSVVLAYEPVWAIGTGETATPADAQEVCAAVRTQLAELYSGDLADGVRVLYGGSVKGDNIGALMAEADIDGALVGGASLSAEAFVPIVRFTPAPD